jgi:hypothetical protein
MKTSARELAAYPPDDSPPISGRRHRRVAISTEVCAVTHVREALVEVADLVNKYAHLIPRAEDEEELRLRVSECVGSAVLYLAQVESELAKGHVKPTAASEGASHVLDELHHLEDEIATVAIAVEHDHGNTAGAIAVAIDRIGARLREAREEIAAAQE